MLVLTLTLLWVAGRLEARWSYTGSGAASANRLEASRRRRRDERAAAGRKSAVVLWSTGGLVFLFIYVPLLVVIAYSFHTEGIIAWPLRLGTLHWYGVLAQDRGMIEAAVASLKLAILAVAIALAIGVPGEFVLDRFDFPGKEAFRKLVLLPLILPASSRVWRCSATSPSST